MSDPLKKVQPGQKLTIPAAAYNAFIDAAMAEKSRLHNVERWDIGSMLQPSVITIRNQTNQNQPRFAVLAIDQPIVTPAANLQQFKNRVAFSGSIPTNPLDDKRVVILAEPLAAGGIGQAVLTGATPVIVNVSNTNHKFAAPAHNITANLASAETGPYRILWRETGSGMKWAVVSAEPKADSSDTHGIVFDLLTALSPSVGQLATAQIVASTDPANYPIGQAVVVTNTGQMRGRVGARGVAIKFGSAWWVVNLNQPTVLARFQFSGNTHSPASTSFGSVANQIAIVSSNFTSITPYPFSGIPSAPITNPSNLIAFTGDSGLCVWDTATEQYILIAVYPQLLRRFYFKLQSNWPNGLDQTFSQATCLHSDASQSGGNLVVGSITLRDRWNVASNAKINDVGCCQLNYSTGQFDVLEVSHVCRIGRARVVTAFSNKPTTFQVNNVQGFDGRSPTLTPSQLLTIQNDLAVEAAEAAQEIDIRWNPLQGHFYALPPSSKSRVFPVNLNQTGGSQGTASGPATWTYTVFDAETSQVLLSNVNPVNSPHKWQRPSVGQMIKATFGYAHYQNNGSSSPQLVVGWVNEVADQQACETDEGNGGGPGPNPPIELLPDFPLEDDPAEDQQPNG